MKEHRQILYLVRGLPGSGKSTIAKNIVAKSAEKSIQVMHYEGDDFHTYVQRVVGHEVEQSYNFNVKLVGAAHDLCYGRTMRALSEGHDAVVANTFTTKRELGRYISGVERSELPVDIIVLKATGDFKTIHNVPDAVISRMRDRWEDYTKETEVTSDG